MRFAMRRARGDADVDAELTARSFVLGDDAPLATSASKSLNPEKDAPPWPFDIATDSARARCDIVG